MDSLPVPIKQREWVQTPITIRAELKAVFKLDIV